MNARAPRASARATGRIYRVAALTCGFTCAFPIPFTFPFLPFFPFVGSRLTHADEDRRATTTSANPTASDGPSVDALCKIAVELALADPDRARAFVSRARVAGWLPETTFRVYRRFARTEGATLEDPITGSAVPVDIKAIDDVRYEWRATWDLSRIVYNPDEIPAHLEGLRMADVRRDIQFLVIRLYFERKRLLLDTRESSQGGDASSARPERPGDEKRLLRVLEIEAELDALSHGAFSSARAPSPSPVPPPS